MSTRHSKNKVIPLETEDIYPDEDQDCSIFLQKAFTLIDEAEKIEESTKFRDMIEYQNARFIIFPDDNLRMFWDMIIMILMSYTVTITPYRVAFIETDTEIWIAIDYLIDGLFMLDLILNCFMAYTNNEGVLVVSHWAIVKNYFKTWMFFDLISCLPTQAIFDGLGWDRLLKLSKLPRLYRLIKIVKLLRLFKVLKNRNKVLMCLECFSKLSIGMERLIYFILCILVTCHLFACFLYFIASFNSDNVNNWVVKYGIEDLSLGELYLASVYWTVTTLCTIGYGDITPASDIERGVVVFVELAGVFLYSYTIGTITSLMAEMDKRKAKLDNKLVILQEITKKYNISRIFYEKLKSALEYHQSTLNKERNDIITILPKKLAMQLNIVINRNLIDKNKFFEGKQIKFITTVIEYLNPLKVRAKEIIYRKGEFTEEIFLIKSGQAILFDTIPESDIVLSNLTEGDYFGDVEVFLSEIREFSAKATKPCELFTLSREDLFTKILRYFEEYKYQMIKEANNRQESLYQRKEEIFFSGNPGLSIPNDLNSRKLLSTPNDRVRDYAELRKTLAPTSRALLDPKEESTADDLIEQLERIEIIIQSLEEQSGIEDINCRDTFD